MQDNSVISSLYIKEVGKIQFIFYMNEIKFKNLNK